MSEDGWIRHHGGPCPVDAVRMVYIKLRDGWTDEEVGPHTAAEWIWAHYGNVGDIIAYRLSESEKALGDMRLTPEMIDAGARHLRETSQSGKNLVEWSKVPKSAKRKWLTLSEGTLRAALLSQGDTSNG